MQPDAISEANHRISNNLTLLASTISMRATKIVRRHEPMESAEVASILNEIVARIVTVGRLHRLLSTQPDADQVDINAYLRDLCHMLIATLGAPDQIELIETAADECLIATDDVLPLSLIATELVTNSLKYAHPSGVRGKLMIGCRHDGDGTLVIEIGDDGVGLPEGSDFADAGGIGSRTVRVLVNQLGAELSYDSRPIGLWFELRLPPRG